MFDCYESYRDSGIEWLGEIPSEWEVKRVKDIFYQISYKVSELEKNTYIPLENIEAFTGKLLKQVSNENNEDCLAFKKNDLLFNKLRPYLAKALLAEFDGGISQEVIVMRVKRILEKVIFPKYFLLRVLSKSFISKSNSMTDGVKMPRANPYKIMNLNLAIPPLKTQQKIATYLDTKTQKIDKERRLLEEKIEKYKELKQTLINETVLRGLDKSVELKDSGVEWIGDIPLEWNIERIGIAFDERSTKVNDRDYPPLSVTKKGIVPQLDNVAKTMHNDNRRLVLKGDYVINSRSDRRGSSGIALRDGSVSVINIVLAPTKDFYGKYLHHLFRSYSFIEEFYRNGRGIVYDLWTTRYFLMKAIIFAYPSLKEQKEIANYLDNKTNQIDQIIKTIETTITLQKEFRKTLINDIVTGKVKV